MYDWGVKAHGWTKGKTRAGRSAGANSQRFAGRVHSMAGAADGPWYVAATIEWLLNAQWHAAGNGAGRAAHSSRRRAGLLCSAAWAWEGGEQRRGIPAQGRAQALVMSGTGRTGV